MVMDLLDKTTVNLRAGSLNMSQVVDMPIFFLTDWKFKEISNDGKNGISMVIVMKRKIVSEIMTTYFPSLLLTAITFATTFFKPMFFEAASSLEREPDHHAGDDHHLYEQDGEPAPHL